jgi:hypothetical protein
MRLVICLVKKKMKKIKKEEKEEEINEENRPFKHSYLHI